MTDISDPGSDHKLDSCVHSWCIWDLQYVVIHLDNHDKRISMVHSYQQTRDDKQNYLDFLKSTKRMQREINLPMCLSLFDSIPSI